MKAADGTKIAEIVRYWTTCEDGIHSMDPAPQGKGNWVRYTDHLATLSAAEERERVLRDLIKKRFGKCGRSGCRAVTGMVNRNFCPDCAAIDAALATPTPEQPAEKGPVSE